MEQNQNDGDGEKDVHITRELSRVVYLVTKFITVQICDFGDVKNAFPANDYVDQAEQQLKDETEEKIVENCKCAFMSLSSARRVAEGFFVDAKKYVNSLGNARFIDDSTKRDTDIDPRNFTHDNLTWLNQVPFEVDINGTRKLSKDKTNFVIADIRVVITEMQLV